MVDWLQISQTEGEGDAIITLTASTYTELQDRITSLTVSGQGRSKTLSVTQRAFEIDSIYFGTIEWAVEIPASGGVGDKDNCIYSIFARSASGQIKDITDLASVSSTSITVEQSLLPYSHSAGTITLTATYDGHTVSEDVTVMQAAFNAADYVTCVYETTEDEETIRLFGTYHYGVYDEKEYYTRSVSGTSAHFTSEPFLDEILLEDGEWLWRDEGYLDEFYFPTAGRHTVYIKFKDKTVCKNPRSFIDGNGGYRPQYPWQGNTALVEIYIPSGYTFVPWERYGSEDDFKYTVSLFYACSNLETIEIESSGFMTDYFCHNNTVLEKCSLTNNTVGAYAFDGCTSLSDVGGLLRDITDIGFAAFCGCTSLPISYLDVENATVAEKAFDECVQIQSVAVGNNSNTRAYANVGEGGTLYWNVTGGTDYVNPVNHYGKFRKVVLLDYPNRMTTDYFSWQYPDNYNNYLEEVEFLPTTQADWRMPVLGGGDGASPFNYVPNLNKIIMHSPQPIKQSPLFDNLDLAPAYGGTLEYPQGQNYSQFLSNDEGWLGSIGWNGVEPKQPVYKIEYEGWDAFTWKPVGDTLNVQSGYSTNNIILAQVVEGYPWDSLTMDGNELPDWLRITHHNVDYFTLIPKANSGETRSTELHFFNQNGEIVKTFTLNQLGAQTQLVGLTLDLEQNGSLPSTGYIYETIIKKTAYVIYEGGITHDVSTNAASFTYNPSFPIRVSSYSPFNVTVTASYEGLEATKSIYLH